MSLACMYCTHYRYDKELTNAFWKLTQCESENVPMIGRCEHGDNDYGNATLSTGFECDGVKGCPHFEDRRKSMKYRVGDTFETDHGLIWVRYIKHKYFPACYRMGTQSDGEYSFSESDLDNLKLIWMDKEEE